MDVAQDGALSAGLELLRGARHGRAGLLLIEGEAGVGKTTVLRLCRQRAAPLVAVEVTGVEAEVNVPYAGVLSLCQPLMQHLAAVTERERRTLSVTLGRQNGPPTTPGAVGAALVQLLAAAAATQPLLVTVDDLQWLDQPSRAAVLFALRRLSHESIAAILAFRTSAQASSVTGVTTVRLTGMTLDAAMTMVAGHALVVPREVMAEIVEACAGNPLAVLMAARELDPAQRAGLRSWTPQPMFGLDRRVARQIATQLAGLPSQASTALEILALASASADRAEIEHALGVAGVDPQVLVQVADHGSVQLKASAVQFTHPLIRSAVLDRAGPSSVRAAHLVWATALQSVDNASPDREQRAAWHLAAAAPGPSEELSSRMEALAEAAAGRGDMASSARGYEVAAELSGQAFRRAACYLLAGQAAARSGLPTADSLLCLARQNGSDGVLLDRIDAVAAALAGWSGHSRTVSRIAQRHDRAVHGEQSRHRRTIMSLIHGSAAMAAWQRWDRGAMTWSAQRIPQLQSDLPTEAVVLGAAGRAMMAMSDGRDAAPDLRFAVEVFRRAPVADVGTPLIQTLLQADLVPEAESVLETAIDAARYHSAVPALTWLNLMAAVVAVRRGNLATALAWAREAAELSRAIDLPLAWLQTRAFCVLVSATSGQQLPVRETRQLWRAAEQMQTEAVLVYLGLARSRAEANAGHIAQAVEAYRDTVKRLDRMGSPPLGELPALPELVVVLARAGRQGEARIEADRLQEVTAGDQRPSTRAWRAHCDAVTSDSSEADERYEQAAAGWAQAHCPLPLADLHFDHGQHLLNVGRTNSARQAFGTSMSCAQTYGLDAMVEAARAALLRIGGHGPPPVQPGRAQALTTREQAIASLVATGTPTRDVARTLFVSPKTVEFHLTSIFRKLGVRSRTELAHLLAQQP